MENASACRCPYSSFSGKTSPSHLRGLISKLQAHLGYNAPWGVLSRPPRSPSPLPIWGICNALCNIVHFKETSKATVRVALSFRNPMGSGRARQFLASSVMKDSTDEKSAQKLRHWKRYIAVASSFVQFAIFEVSGGMRGSVRAAVAAGIVVYCSQQWRYEY
ncbi:hypothetical protein ALC53_01962 [Atta colombica]|uniref:Uncharacterized protein n=1 Tax=Atta colombica TaxID=520822 RepID=A0A195BRL1_9HYME|nr:hypothetical protein ALC53_01962 [Atta colombica]